MADFETQVVEYATAVEGFRAEHGLPDEWFAEPDHIAIKCADATDYEQTIETWVPKAKELSYIQLNGRRLATAKLLSPMMVGNLGAIEWLEIMEPRPEKVGIDTVGVDHMEFYFADFEAARLLLSKEGILYEDQANPNHQWLSILANGHELKLNDRVLADIVAMEIATKEAVILK